MWEFFFGLTFPRSVSPLTMMTMMMMIKKVLWLWFKCERIVGTGDATLAAIRLYYMGRFRPGREFAIAL